MYVLLLDGGCAIQFAEHVMYREVKMYYGSEVVPIWWENFVQIADVR